MAASFMRPALKRLPREHLHTSSSPIITAALTQLPGSCLLSWALDSMPHLTNAPY